MFRYSWSQARFIGETLEASLERLGRLRYDGVELPQLSMQPSEVTARLKHHGLSCASINGRFIGADRDLLSSDQNLRSKAAAYVLSCMRVASSVGAPFVIVVPTHIGKLRPASSRAEDWDHAVASLREIGQFGQDLGVTAVVNV